jgi:hypothetical protein
MHPVQYFLGATSLGLAALLTLGCDNSTAPVTPTEGEIVIVVSTTGPTDAVDPDGYTLSIDGGPAQSLGINALVTIGSLPWGKHLIQLEGLASNCSLSSLSDTNPLNVDLIPNKLHKAISFVVLCNGEEDPWG